MWSMFFWLSGGQLGWAELAVGGWLCECVRSFQGVVGLGAEQRQWDRTRQWFGTVAGESVSLVVTVGTAESWSVR